MDQTLSLEEIQQSALESGNWEPLREYYMPKLIRLLLVANAAPRERFFYLDDVENNDGVFNAVAKAICPDEYINYQIFHFKDNNRIESKRIILNLLKDKGIYLIDIMPKTKEEALEEADLTYWLNQCKKDVDKLPLAKDCRIVLCHTNSHKLYSFFSDRKYETEKLPCPVQRNSNSFKIKGTFITKLSKLYKKIEGNG